SGDIDPAIVEFIAKKEDLDISGVLKVLNGESGVYGLSGGLSSDFRDLESAANRGDDRSQLAIDVFAYKVKKYIGGYVAAMGGVDAIVFTAGLGENSPFMRDKICNGLEYLGTRIDPDLNQVRGKEREISVRRARVKIFVIPTNEELVIARDTYNICRRIIKL
ncbi:MAG: acetate kinase, partial [Phascolarctobacterium sp.]